MARKAAQLALTRMRAQNGGFEVSPAVAMETRSTRTSRTTASAPSDRKDEGSLHTSHHRQAKHRSHRSHHQKVHVEDAATDTEKEHVEGKSKRKRLSLPKVSAESIIEDSEEKVRRKRRANSHQNTVETVEVVEMEKVMEASVEIHIDTPRRASRRRASSDAKDRLRNAMSPLVKGSPLDEEATDRSDSDFEPSIASSEEGGVVADENGADSDVPLDVQSQRISSQPRRRRNVVRPSQSRRRSEKGANKEEKKHKKGKKGKTAWNSAVPEVQDLSDYEWKPTPDTLRTAPPKDLIVDLLPFQRDALEWMTQQEHSTWKGGILADEQGMGKTIETISLLVANQCDRSKFKRSGNKMPTTIVVCPLVAVHQWKNEIERHTRPGLFKVRIYHGADRDQWTQDDFFDTDILLTTYSIMESDFRKQNTGMKRKGELIKKPSPLHTRHWYRIVLDEAHSIKERYCSTARAAVLMEATYRWCLSGTPLQNRVGELYSLIRFLRLDPYSYYFCKKCGCKSLTWPFHLSNTCSLCEHKGMSHFCWWNRYILNPITKWGYEFEGADAMKTLSKVLKRIMLRRTKVEKAADLKLPPREGRCNARWSSTFTYMAFANPVLIRWEELDDEENDFYESIYMQSRRKFLSYVQEDTLGTHYANVFELLIRLRQAVDHPYLVIQKGQNVDEKDEVCELCSNPFEDPVKTNCGHLFCRGCMELYIASVSSDDILRCPTCRKKLQIDMTQGSEETPSPSRAPTPMPAKRKSKVSIMTRANVENWRTSTKLEALLEELVRVREEDPNVKSIVFSQFVNFLDVIDWRLRRAGFKCVKLDGRMNIFQRAEAIATFTTDPDTTIFLISLKAGGVALNLTVASRVFIMDPWWNPATEEQAMDRIHRLGQLRPVVVTRFIITNTIEERIMKLQAKKKLLFQSTVGMDTDALSRLTQDDLKYLFRV